MTDLDLRPTADGFATLYSARYGQTYHSCHGAGLEAQHVFLDGAGVAERLDTGKPTDVLEVGFGTGLNFMLTAQHALATNTPLTFTSLERDVLPAAALRALKYAEHLGPIAKALIDWRAALPDVVTPGPNRLAFDAATLDLIVGDATEAALPRNCDAVYLDAFSPDANPELWTPPFLQQLHDALRPGGRLATYSVRRSVREALAEAGFEVHKRPGPPGKRECLVAVRQ